MRQMILNRFDGWINWKFKEKHPEMCKFLLEHERKPVVIDNLCEQVVTLELKLPGAANTKTLSEMIDGIAAAFCKTALKHKEQELVSDLENRKKQDAARKEQELEDYAKENLKEVGEKVTEI